MTTDYTDRMGDYILTHTGRRFYVLDPRPEDINLTDIAVALSRVSRSNGHSTERYTVAEHTVRGVNLMANLNFTIEEQVAFLLHDASEAYLADIPKPIKQYLSDYMELEEKVQNAIYTKYLGSTLTPEQYEKVKFIDQTMLVNEMQQLMIQDSAKNSYLDESDVIFVDLSTQYCENTLQDLFKGWATILGIRD